MLAFGAVLTLYGAFMVFSRWCLNSPAVPEDMIAQLRVGMTQDEVRQLLGKPRAQAQWRDHPEWFYGHRLKRHLLRLRFDNQGLLRQFQHVSKYDPDHCELA
jgi:outer membrane protein assembly factor BamE (lipoprotein component of BamABCDE complex)